MNLQLCNTERKTLYRLLAALFRYPEQGLLDSLSLSLQKTSAFLNLPLPADTNQVPELIDLEVAYTGLFINCLGGAAAPPYGSVYLESDAQLMGSSCLQVVESYRSEGLNLDASDEPADFLATELEFLYYLVAEEEGAENSAVALGWKKKQGDFSRELLHPWLKEFCQRIEQTSGVHPLYAWAAEALLQFSELEQNYFSR